MLDFYGQKLEVGKLVAVNGKLGIIKAFNDNTNRVIVNIAVPSGFEHGAGNVYWDSRPFSPKNLVIIDKFPNWIRSIHFDVLTKRTELVVT